MTLVIFPFGSAPDIQDLNIIDEKDTAKPTTGQTNEYGRKPTKKEPARVQAASPGVSTVAVKRKPRTQVAESLAKVTLF